jgi:hypothetical protein
MQPVDEYALMEWLKEKSLDAHNSESFSRNGESTEYDDGVFAGREEAFNEVVEHIQNGRENARPHMKERI